MNMQVLEARRDVSGGYKVDVTRGERIGRVSSEWFSRPHDERFLSLGELAGAVRGRAERSQTRVVETALIHVEAIRTGEASDSRLMTRVLGSFRYKLVGSPDYFAAHGTPKTPADLAAHRCLRHRYPSTGKLEEWPLVSRRSGPALDLPTAATSSAIEPLVYVAERGLGIACLPDFAVREQVGKRTLVSVMDGALNHSGTFRILWPSSRQLAPKIRVFVDFMAENLFAERITI